uniref:Ubiquitin-like domain-containing protein n=1 Tax=Chenopodium quinoa TaxID=63459 RepID=A0A803LTV4_CHEQI
MKRRYRPDVPIDLTSEEEQKECSAKHKEETKKIGVKVVKWSNSKSDDQKEKGDTLKIKIDIPLRWLMICYCQKLGLDYQTTRFEFNGGSSRYRSVYICIRVHKERDAFLRVKRNATILPQLTRYFSSGGSQEQGSLCFVYNGLILDGNHIAKELSMEDGDIIDAFNFDTMSSSLSMIHPHLTLRVECVSGNVTMFRVTPKTRVVEIMNRLVPSKPELGREPMIFICGGRRLSPSKTVEENKLVDGDTIASLFCQTGC